jgi:hypothetical protein
MLRAFGINSNRVRVNRGEMRYILRFFFFSFLLLFITKMISMFSLMACFIIKDLKLCTRNYFVSLRYPFNWLKMRDNER